jgi:hypothetical protein
MQRGNILSVYKSAYPIEKGYNVGSKRYHKNVRFRKLPFQEYANWYSYVPLCTLLFLLLFVLIDLRLMQSHENLTEYKNVCPKTSDHTGRKHYKKMQAYFTFPKKSTLFNSIRHYSTFLSFSALIRHTFASCKEETMNQHVKHSNKT